MSGGRLTIPITRPRWKNIAYLCQQIEADFGVRLVGIEEVGRGWFTVSERIVFTGDAKNLERLIKKHREVLG